MAATGTPTPNIGLRIPLGTDPASVDDINYNSNLIDTKLGAVGNDSVQDQIDDLNSKISNLIHLKSISGTTNTGGNLNLGLGLITNKIIGAYLGYNSSGHGGYLLNAENYAWFHVVDGSGNAITNTNVTVNVIYVDNWYVDT